MVARCRWLQGLMWAFVLALSTQGSAAAVSFNVVSGKLESKDGALHASADGAIIRFEDGVSLRLAPGAVLYRQHQKARLWLTASGRTPTDIIAVKSGRVDVMGQEVPAARATHAVMIQAPRKVNVLALGGRMTLIVKPDAINVVNHTSRTLVGIGSGKYAPLAESTVRAVSSGEDTQSGLLPAPSVQLARDLYAAFGQGAELSKIRWQPVEGAAAYAVYIDQVAPEGGNPWRIETSAPELSPMPRLAAGRYALRVRAIDRHEIEGSASPTLAFNVLGVQAADGGYIDLRGNIVAGYDRRVRLTYADGLIMKGGELSQWLPVPDEIVLPSDQPLSLHLRKAGGTELVSTRLVAHRVVAFVSVGPKLLRWPGESARIQVQVSGEGGGPPPRWVEPRLRVLLGVDELDVTWTARGERLIAEVPPQPGVGPWVLRVEVEDQYGHSIGRDFVEIAPRVELPAAPAPPPAKDLRATGESR